MDPVVAIPAWHAGLFSARRSGAFPLHVALQFDFAADSPRASVPAVPRAAIRSNEPSTRFATLRRTSAYAGEAGPLAFRFANAFRIRGGRELAESRSGRPRVHGDLFPCALWRRALRYHPPAPTPRSSPLGAARPLISSHSDECLSPVLQLRIAQRRKFTAYDQGRIHQPGMPEEPRGQRGDDGYSYARRLRTDGPRGRGGDSCRQHV